MAPEHCLHAPKPPMVEPCNTDKPCGPPPELKIACFRDTSTPSGIPELLADYTNIVDFDNPEATVLACSQEAYNRGYKYFGLGQGGKCYSGPNVKRTYYKDGPSNNAAGCNNGVGLQGYQYVYTLDPLPTLEGLGCFADHGAPNRALPVLYAYFRYQIDWSNMNQTIHQCAHMARDKGYDLFGVQYYGECWAGGTNYDRWGEATNCFSYAGSWLVGSNWSNYVYRFNQGSVSSRRK